MKAMDYRKLARGNAFADEVRKQAYDLLKAESLLDRPIAHDFMQEVEAYLTAYARPLPRACFRIDRIHLRKGDSLSPHIYLRQSRANG